MTRHPRLDSSAVSWQQPPAIPLTNRVPEVTDLATRQQGVLHRSQLRELGVSHHRVEHEVGVGRWSAVAPDVVVAHNTALTKEQRKWLGVLHAGPQACLTHATACEHRGLRWTADDVVHVLTPRGDLAAGIAGIRFHQSRRRYAGWVVRDGDGLPCLDLEHAVLLTSERDHHLRRAVGRIAAAVQQGLSTAPRLRLAARSISKLRHGALFRLALGDIEGGAQSFAEIDVGALCRSAGLQPPERQLVRLDRTGRRRYLDCVWHLDAGRLLVLEVDGSFHLRVENWWQDLRRERRIVAWDRLVLRCASIELRLEPAGILDDLTAMGVPRDNAGFVSASPA